MVWYAPSAGETEIMKKIHEIAHNKHFGESEREALLRYNWTQLEALHGSKVVSIKAPSGETVQRPVSMDSPGSWFTPTPLEISMIEQIETAFLDDTLSENDKKDLIEKLWTRLERIHKSKVFSLVSPEGVLLERPFGADV